MRKKASRASQIRQWLFSVVMFMVILTVAAVLAVAVLIPRLGGATPYTILTSSMKPDMPPGTLVVAKPVDVSELGVGSVVTYQISSGKPTVVTHRIVGTSIDTNGQPVFRTQGDANNVADQNWVRPEQIKGARWYYVPYLGYGSTLLTGSQRQVGVYLLGGALLTYAMTMFGGALRDRTRNRRRVDVPAS